MTDPAAERGVGLRSVNVLTLVRGVKECLKDKVLTFRAISAD